MRVELTPAFLRSIKPPPTGKRLEIRDTAAQGLVVRVTSAGVVTFAARGRRKDGTEARVTLGKWPKMSLTAARNDARRKLVEVADGIDHAAAKRNARTMKKERATEPTVAMRLAEWMAANEKRWSPRYAGEVARLVKVELGPSVGKMLLREVTREVWTRLLARVVKYRPALGAHLYRVTASFLAYSDAHGWIAEHPLPRRGGSRIAPSVASRERVLTNEELRKLWNATAAMNPGPRCFAQLLMTTGCRISEAAGIAAGELDPDTNVWRLPAHRAKNDQPHVMQVPPALMTELMARLPCGDRERLAGYRLLGRTKGGAIGGYSKIKAKLDHISGVTDWRFHDLRRTVRTGLSRLGVSREVAEACINHIGGRVGIVGTYDRYDYEPEILTALRRWQAALTDIVKDKPGKGVHTTDTLRRKAA